MGLDGALAQDELLGNEGRTPSLGIERSSFHLSGSQSVLGSKGVPDIHVRRSGEGALGATTSISSRERSLKTQSVTPAKRPMSSPRNLASPATPPAIDTHSTGTELHRA